ncbi:uncharacterized protein LOC125703815 isoform X1 [Lagopus muta]|uniref:uncharacterized protein LOC125703815 isoform X1 n=1 Tax=Lagopus muta TaxID=64668 RepID=UPI00209E0F9C|nr:uncharacterized protein LOC125703815 isoform X1 [Lagopus muta]XP_048824767.1 uncharacterized protein LOC125703815 isoform X1 [Lagopus muta]
MKTLAETQAKEQQGHLSYGAARAPENATSTRMDLSWSDVFVFLRVVSSLRNLEKTICAQCCQHICRNTWKINCCSQCRCSAVVCTLESRLDGGWHCSSPPTRGRMHAVPKGCPLISSTTLGSLSLSQELGEKQGLQSCSGPRGAANWDGGSGRFHHVPGPTDTALSRTENITLVQLLPFLAHNLQQHPAASLHLHCRWRRCSCPQDAVSPGSPYPRRS